VGCILNMISHSFLQMERPLLVALSLFSNVLMTFVLLTIESTNSYMVLDRVPSVTSSIGFLQIFLDYLPSRGYNASTKIP
jgi:hypothetical protein